MPRWVLLGFCKEEASKQPVCFEMFCFGLNNCLSCVSAQKIVFLIKTHAAYMISCRGSCKSLRHSVVFSLGTFSFPPFSVSKRSPPPADPPCLLCIKTHSVPITASTSPWKRGLNKMVTVFWVTAEKNLTQCACVCDYFPVPLHPFSHLMPFKGSLK